MLGIGRRADANFHPGELVRAQVGDDVLDAVVTAGGAGGPHPELAHGQRDVVIDHQHMNPKNAAELLAQPDIDGGLIGGAALKPDQFVDIINAANQE